MTAAGTPRHPNGRFLSKVDRLTKKLEQVQRDLQHANGHHMREAEIHRDALAAREADCNRMLVDRDTHHQQMMDRQREETAKAVIEREEWRKRAEAFRDDASRMNSQNRAMWHVLCDARDNRWVRILFRGLHRRILSCMGFKPDDTL